MKKGTGFFCKIPFPDLNNMLPVFITNNHIIGRDLLYKGNERIGINIEEEENIKYINLKNRMRYTDKEDDITIIEIKEKDNIKNYLELDDKIINNILNDSNKNKNYIDEIIYTIQYPKGKLSVSYGTLEKINENKKHEFTHKCSTENGSSGSPILNVNNKLIGIHKEGYSNYNKGTFLNYAIKDYIKLFCKNINELKSQQSKNNELLIQEFNKKNKYIPDIKDSNIIELDLYNSGIYNESLKDLCKIEFKQLKILNLERNQIDDIKALEKAKFENLEMLYLGNNEISDINILEKVNFLELKELDLA